MLRRAILLFSIIVFVLTAWSNPIDINRAQKAAIDFYQKIVHSTPPSTPDCQLAFAQQISSKGNSVTAYYIFNVGEGFVIVSADDRIDPILGYSTQNPFNMEKAPSNVQHLLNEYQREIQCMVGSNKEAPSRWDAYERTKGVLADTIVAPLISTQWGQKTYYNDLCPADTNGFNGHTATGCVATAMAQVINYWEHPAIGNGEFGYEANFSYLGSGNYGYLYANFGATTYDYANMPDILDSNSTPEQIAAVATLIYHCGISIQMMYGPNGSGATDLFVPQSLCNYFRYEERPVVKSHSSYNTTTWNQLIKDELDVSAPVLLSGNDPEGGHEFVCDGYDSRDLFHINWGWNGDYDGFYHLSLLNPDEYSFSSDQRAIVNIRPTVVGIETSNNGISIYPNPSHNQVSISADNVIHDIRIADLSGKILLHDIIGAPSTTIDISKLSSGIYILNATTDKGMISEKIVKY